MKGNPQSLIETKVAIPLTVFTATPGTEVAIDTRGYSEALITLIAGTFTSSATMDVPVHESDNADGSSSSAISGAAFAQLSTSLHQQRFVGRVNLQKKKRYLYLPCTFGGSGNAPIAALIQLIGPRDTILPDDTFVFSVGD